ncbi:MAG: hypothetical protein EBT95_04735 [Verrucomicrobia bacterium]|nr:hypothetical protein [Verrucomicrobiota bacterium]
MEADISGFSTSANCQQKVSRSAHKASSGGAKPRMAIGFPQKRRIDLTLARTLGSGLCSSSRTKEPYLSFWD